MKLQGKLAGVCSAGTFAVMTLMSVSNPAQTHIETIVMAVPASVIAGIFGYALGVILSRPDDAVSDRKGGGLKRKEAKLTGEETFLNDLEIEDMQLLPGLEEEALQDMPALPEGDLLSEGPDSQSATNNDPSLGNNDELLGIDLELQPDLEMRDTKPSSKEGM